MQPSGGTLVMAHHVTLHVQPYPNPSGQGWGRVPSTSSFSAGVSLPSLRPSLPASLQTFLPLCPRPCPPHERRTLARFARCVFHTAHELTVLIITSSHLLPRAQFLGNLPARHSLALICPPSPLTWSSTMPSASLSGSQPRADPLRLTDDGFLPTSKVALARPV